MSALSDHRLETIRAAAKEIADDGYPTPGLRITLEPVLSLANAGRGIRFGLRIERERRTPSGRLGKPTMIVMLINNPDESPADMLRTLAEVVDGEAKR